MNLVTTIVHKADAYQRKHPVPGFVYGVVKKYGEDNGGYQSSIITYYALLSLFPLLIVFTALTQLLLKNNATLKAKISTSATHYFPVIGSQLQQSIHSPKKTGIALLISLAVTLYGARGGASAFQYAMNTLWRTSPLKQPPFLKNILRSFGIIGAAGVGLVAGVVLSGYATALGRGLPIRIAATLLSAAILWFMLIILFKLAVAGNKRIKDVLVGALCAAIGLQILQTAGTAILSHELKGLNNIYGTFALVVGLLFWIYIQAEVVLYAVEIDVVRAYHLFPRSLQGELTESDKTAYTKYAEAATHHADESVHVRFHKKDSHS
jgi:membrane protein